MDKFMQAALDEARLGAEEGGVPIGAALVDGDTIIATGRNRRLQDSTPTMHAEMNCLLNASKSTQDFSGMTIYTTMMPCHMCAGAVVQFGIAKVVAAESDNSGEGIEMMKRHGVEVIDLELDEAKRLVQAFIQANPDQRLLTPEDRT